MERQKTPKAKKMKLFFGKTLVKPEKTGYSLNASEKGEEKEGDYHE